MPPTENPHPDANLSEHGAERYPATLRLTVGSADDAFDRAIDQAASDEIPDEAVRSFDRVADVRQLLTDRRLEVMRTIMADSPASISELAEVLERNYADVHGDVQVLADHHVVYFETDGRSKRPVIPYQRVYLDVELAGGPSGGRAHA